MNRMHAVILFLVLLAGQAFAAADVCFVSPDEELGFYVNTADKCLPADGLSASQSAASYFYAPLTNTLVPTNCFIGSCTPTFTRATTATVVDHEGLVKAVKSGEARFSGARRVENLVAGSENFNIAPWSKDPNVTVTVDATIAPDGTLTADLIDNTAGANTATISQPIAIAKTGKHVFSVWLKADTPHIATVRFAGTNANVSVTTSWQRFENKQTPSAGTTYAVICPGQHGTATGTVYAWGAQVERVDGQASEVSSDYVSCGVASAPYFGANTDCVKYFSTTNGNTVASNVVTEATGIAIADATLLGYLAEGARTNNALQSEAAGTTWTTSNITVTSNAIAAPDGRTTADILTATADNGTLLQPINITNQAYDFSVYMKRKTGTGTVSLTLDEGNNWTDKTITTSWARYDITRTPATTGTYASLGSELITNGNFAAWTGDNPNGWTLSGSETGTYYVTEDAGKARLVSDGTYFTIAQNILTANKMYKYSIDVTAAASGGLTLACGSDVITLSTVATHTGYTYCTSVTLTLKRSGVTDVTFDNVSLKEVIPTVGIKLGTNTDEIYVWGMQHEAGALATSYIPTTTSNATRNADTLTYPSAGNVDFAKGSVVLKARLYAVPTGAAQTILHASNRIIYRHSGDFWGLFDGTTLSPPAGSAVAANTVYKLGGYWGRSSQHQLFRDGTAVTAASFDGAMGSGTAIGIGADSGGTTNAYGNIRDVKIWKSALPDARLQSLTQ